jgi:ATP-dependent Lhr-like helicase
VDTLCRTAGGGWARLDGRVGRASEPNDRPTARPPVRLSTGPIRSTPVALFLREHANEWLAGRNRIEYPLSTYAQRTREVLEQRGALFFHELVAMSGLLPTQVEQALAELAGEGLVTSDSFAGLRALITPSHKRKPLAAPHRRHRTAPYGIESAGRWSLLSGRSGGQADGQSGGRAAAESSASKDDQQTSRPSDRPSARPSELYARTLLKRYGVVFKRLLARETNAPPWRDLLMVYRRLEARGEIRGGRFVSGMSGEQFALPEAVAQLRATRRLEHSGRLLSLSAADPLNLTGILTPGERIPGVTSNRILYRDGVPVLAREAGEVRSLEPTMPSAEMLQALVRKSSTPALRRYLGLAGTPASSAVLNRRPGRREQVPSPEMAQ